VSILDKMRARSRSRGRTIFNDPLFSQADPRLLLRFIQYHEENPQVYQTFKDYAQRIKATGRGQYSGWVICQVIRWERDVQTRGDVFKLNNDFIALYSRLLIAERPEFADFLELREMKPVRKLSFVDAQRQYTKQRPYKGV
jgi:hypothetical protein